MAGSDPKLNRALEQTSARNDIDAEEDPLVELARIVSEDGAFGMGKPEKPKVIRSAPVARPSLEDGLEAELLQELETSFAARETPAPPAQRPAPVRGNSAPAPSRAPVAPAQRADEDPDPDELLRSIEEQLGQFERRHAARFSAAPPSFDSDAAAAEDVAPDWAEEEPKTPVFGAPSSSAESRRSSRIRPFAESAEDLDIAPEPVSDEEEPPVRSTVRSDYRFRGPAGANWDRAPRDGDTAEASRDDFEDTAPPSAPEQEDDLFAQADIEAARVQADADLERVGRGDGERPSESRRERITATFPEFDEEPAAARQQADLSGLEAGLSRELEPQYQEASQSDKWRDGDAPTSESKVAAAIAPGPSRRAAAARAAAQRGRSRVGLFTAAGIILVVLIGAGGALYLRSSEQGASGPPPVIAAEEGAVRVEPAQDQAAAEGETVGEAVYNRVAGAQPETEEQVVENAEEPREVARIVLPPSQTEDTQTGVPAGEEAGAAAIEAVPNDAVEGAESEIGPRKVPTFVVRADGSIVETSASGSTAPDPTTAQSEQLAGETEPIEPVPVPTVAIAESGAEGEGQAAPPPALPAEPAPSAEAVDMTPRPSIDEQPAEVAAVESTTATEAPADTATDANASGEATDLLAATESPEAAAPAPAATASDGGFLVQLSAQRSMDQAQSAYASAQQQFPSVLGSLSPQIQEANLGEKGIYFRVRVGPWASRDDAVEVCEALKAAGGSCFVTR